MSNLRGSTSQLTSLIAPDSDRVLVIVHLFGGNDGLNTLIPLDQYANYVKVRNDIYINKSKALKITDTAAMHPSMGEMRGLFDDGKLGIVQNVGYPNQNRSHFRSTDIYTSASRSEDIVRSGWVGRYLDTQYPGYPTGYPSAGQPDPPAISIGNVAHPTCEGPNINFSQTVADPNDPTKLSTINSTVAPDDDYGNELSFVRTTMRQTNAYNNVIQKAYQRGRNRVSYEFKNKHGQTRHNRLAKQLGQVARLIDGGLQTKVYTVYLSGFDTHANQTSPNTVGGVHADLLSMVSHAIGTFQNDLKKSGNEERVLGMTFSEFGRRIRPNASKGTDHGTAGPMFLFGSCVQGGVMGKNPVIDRDVDQSAGVPMEFDFRDVYGSILVDWFDVPEFEVRDVIHDNFKYLPLAGKCNDDYSTTTTSTTDHVTEDGWTIGQPFPNPASNEVRISLSSPGHGKLRYSLFDARGRLVLMNEIAASGSGEQLLFRRPARLPSGTYMLRMATEAGSAFTRKVTFK